MGKLPALTAKKVIRALKRAGFIEDRQKGSHMVLIHPDTKARTVVPFKRAGPLRNLCYAPSFGMRTYRQASSLNCCDLKTPVD
jgi:predicted RNA binding protein YcfA (HicA-like mRNA interferase family)